MPTLEATTDNWRLEVLQRVHMPLELADLSDPDSLEIKAEGLSRVFQLPDAHTKMDFEKLCKEVSNFYAQIISEAVARILQTELPDGEPVPEVMRTTIYQICFLATSLMSGTEKLFTFEGTLGALSPDE